MSAQVNIDAEEAAFFPGCALQVLAPGLSQSVQDWLQEKGLATQLVLRCCGMPQHYEGHTDSFSRHTQSLFEVFEEKSIRRVVVACPNCFRALNDKAAQIGSPIEVVTLSSLLVAEGALIDADSLPSGSVVTVHDSCPDRADQIFAREVRELARHLDVVEMKHGRERTLCCGVGGPFYGKPWDIMEKQIGRRRNEATQVKATHVLSACVNCTVALSQGEGSLESVHYLELLFKERINRDISVSISNALG